MTTRRLLEDGTSLRLLEDGVSVRLLDGPAFMLSASANIAASAATATTARLTAPSGKTSGADFQAGLISDDTNPLPTIDLGSGKYTELEWCVEAASGLTSSAVYQFRVVESDNTALDTYTVTPTWTVGAAAYDVVPDAGSFALTGTAVGLFAGLALTAATTAFAVTGTDAGLHAGYVTTAAAASYDITGTDVTLTYTPNGGYSLTLDAGSYTVTGASGEQPVVLRGPPLALGVAVQAAGAVEGIPFTTQPVVYAVGSNAEQSWNNAGVVITASLHAGTLGTLGGTVTAALDSQGFAQWTDLSIDTAQSNAQIDFSLSGGSGNDTVLDVYPRLVPESGSYALTGSAVSVLAGYVTTASAGSLALTGTDVTLTYTPNTPAFTLSASSNIAASAATATTARLTAPSGKTSGADFQAGFISDDTNPLPTLDLGSGKYTELEWCVVADGGLSTSDVYQFRVVESDDTALDTYTVTPTWTVGNAYNLTLDTGSYALTGTAVGVLHDSLLTLTAGAFDLTGTDVLVERGSFLTIEAGSYTLTGTDASFRQDYSSVPESGVYALTGSNVALTPQSPGGVYTLTGSDVSFTHNIVMPAAAGAYALTGTAVGAYRGAALTLEAGTYTTTGSTVSLVYDMVGAFNLIVEPEAYTLAGSDVSLIGSHPLIITSGTFAVTGSAVGLVPARTLVLAAATYTLTGQTVALYRSSDNDYVFLCDGATFTLTGRPVSMRYGNTLPPDRDHRNRRPRCHPIIGRRR